MANFLDTLKFLQWAEIVERYVLLVLITYLTDVWGLGLTHAAGLINIWVGTTKAMPLAFLFLIDNYTGSYWMCLISTTASGMGMGLMTISTPSLLLSRITGLCSEYKLKCISGRQQSLFYIALILIMIGKSAREATLETLKFKGSVDEQEEKKQQVASGSKAVSVIAGFLLPMIKPWSIRFGISAICSLIAARLLMAKSWSHKVYIDQPERSPVTTVLRVFVASTSKISRELPDESASLYQEIRKDGPPLRPSSTLRFLEKAAIVLPIDKRRRSKWTLCSLQEVEDTKTLVRTLPVCVMFVFLGLISSIGNTYFIEQAKHLNPKFILGQEFSVSFLVSIYDLTKDQLNEHARRKYKNTKRFYRSVGVIAAMFYATMCCLIAAPVEKRRLNVISRHGLANKPNDIIPMTALWLLPQLYILGFVDGIFEQSIQKFFAEEIPSSMKSFGIFMSKGLMGLGTMSSVLVVYLVGKVSEMGGRRSWFQHDTENSRLDRFYWVLTVLCVVVFTIWFKVCIYFDSRRYLNYQKRLPVTKADTEKYIWDKTWD